MKTKIFLAAAFASLLLSACKDVQESPSATETIEQVSTDSHAAEATVSLPSFNLQDAGGNALNLQSLKGKKVLVNIWATWCPPCRREMPSLQKLYEGLDKNKTAFVMLSVDDRFEKAISYVAKNKLDLPIYYPAENLPALFNVQAIPTTFIFNEKGELIRRINGSDDYDSPLYRKLLQ